MSISCPIVTGYNANAIFISPLSTRLFSSPSPLIPPTKSIRLSVRRSVIPNISRSIRLEDTVTSRIPIGSLSSYVPSFAVKEYHLPSTYRKIVQTSRRIDILTLLLNFKILTQFIKEFINCQSVKILHNSIIVYNTKM